MTVQTPSTKLKRPSRLKGLQRPETVAQEREMVAWIKAYQEGHGYSPSIREIGDAMKMAYSHVRNYMTWLERGGYMQNRPFGISRVIIFTEKIKEL